MDWIPALTTTTLFLIIAWLGRNLITARLTNAIRHEYEVKLENLRADLTASQKLIDAEVRLRESQTEALRSGALSGLANRKSELFRKRLHAADQLWGSVLSLGQGKFIAKLMSTIKYEEALKHSEKDKSTRDFFKEVIGTNFDPKSINTIEASKARPYLSKILWALFSAYAAIISMATVRLITLQSGVGKDFMDKNSMIKLIETTLPHQKKIIEEKSIDLVYLLLDELEEKILQEIERMIQGEIDDKESVERAAKIMNIVKEIEKENREQHE